MQTLLKSLQEVATSAIEAAFSQQFPEVINDLPADITQSTQAHFGHYQCNTALKLAKKFKLKPRDIAQKIAAEMESSDLIEKLEIAGPGFINIHVKLDLINAQLNEMLSCGRLGIAPMGKQSKTIVEFSSPNIAKELHVGHLRSTIIGESLARLFEFLGHNVMRLNHVGDWGTQFGMLITYLYEEKSEAFEKGVSLSDLMSWYKASKKKFDDDPEFKVRAQKQVVALQGGDEKALETWKQICDISRLGFEEIYQLLDVSIEERGESFYNPMLADIVSDLSAQGISEISEGAECVFMDGYETRDNTPLPMIVRKADGGFNYSTTDLAAIKQRVQDEEADRIIYVVDMGQRLHFQMVFSAAKLAKYLDPQKVRVDHVDFGVVLGEDGKKFKTRSGETVKLMDLLQEAIARAKVIMKERLPEESDESIEKSATILGINAVKYADLSCHRVKDYVFSYDRMLRFEGNTAAFLLYSYVRIQSIKRKVGKNISDIKTKLIVSHSSEVALGLHLRQFQEMLEIVADEVIPHRICEYLFNLAEKFNHFFRDCHVQGSDEEDSRLLLCELTAQVLEKGLHILGLQTLDRM